jgi:hypothetical protein
LNEITINPMELASGIFFLMDHTYLLMAEIGFLTAIGLVNYQNAGVAGTDSSIMLFQATAHRCQQKLDNVIMVVVIV